MAGAFSACLILLPIDVKAATLYVGGAGPGNYTAIQDAIDNASSGDSIYVYSGVYHERPLIDKSLSLTGEEKTMTIIDGDGIASVVHITADFVNITGFTMRYTGSTFRDAALYLDSVRSCNVVDNLFFQYQTAIFLEYSSNNTIENNDIISGGNGIISLSSPNNGIIDNFVFDNYNGIVLTDSNNTTVINNEVVNGWFSIISHRSNGITIKQNNASQNVNWGIILTSSDYSIVVNNSLYDNRLGIYVDDSSNGEILSNKALLNEYGGINMYRSDNMTITNNSLIMNGDDGILMFFTDNMSIEGNVMVEDGILLIGDSLRHWNSHLIDTTNTVNGKPVQYWKDLNGGIVPPSAGQVILANCTNVIIENQNVSDGTAGISVGFSEQNMIVNNTASRNDDSGFRFYQAGYNIIANNTVSYNGEYNFYIQYSDNLTVDANTVSDSMYGFRFDYSDNLTIRNNTISSNHHGGLFISLTENSTITGNSLISNLRSGVFFNGASSTTLSDNIFFSNIPGPSIDLIRSDKNDIKRNNLTNDFMGIRMASCDNNTVTDNNISNSTLAFFLDYSNTNTVVNNSISQTIQTGLMLFSAHFNTISGNSVLESGLVGVDLRFSSSNRIFHNNFVSNSLQASDDSNSNQWDDGYPSGGNYWSDYAGIDQKSGPNQDQPGSDTIGDTAYIIDLDSQDRYPLMSPFGILISRPPTGLQARLSGKDFENVTLKWELSADDGGGFRTVTGYEIYRSMAYDAGGSGYQLIAAPPNGTSEYVDILVGEGDPNNYFYRVCSIGLNNTSCETNQAAKFTRPMLEGLNLASIPLIQANTTLGAMLPTVSFDKAWFFDNKEKKWLTMSKSKPYGLPPGLVTPTAGFWINVTKTTNLTVAGIVPKQTTIDFYAGWNLIGVPSFLTAYVALHLNISVRADRIEGLDPLSPPYFLKVLQSLDSLQLGHGYWVRVPADDVFPVSNI